MGKSSLLNCLAGRRIAIVDATPGVTRDRISAPVEIGDGFIELVDTGGMGIVDVDDLTDHVESQIRYGVDAAQLILFIVDAREGVTPLDQHVARVLRKQGKDVILVANKIDSAEMIGETGELHKLGFGDPMRISATHASGITDLRERLERQLRGHLDDTPPEAVMKLAIVGKRNAGKSTFVNALAGQDRVIVSETPGTTRDSIDVHVELDGRTFTLIDTAGVRKKSKMSDDIEYYSRHRALRSIRRADVIIFMIDASVPISRVDKHLAGLINEQAKPLVIVINKWDLAAGKADAEDYADYFSKLIPEFPYAPISLTTATEGLNVRQTIRLAEQLFNQANTRITTGKLNTVMAEILELRGPSHKAGTKPPKIYYSSQIATSPPTIVCVVNDTRSFDMSFRRFLVNQFRQRLPFEEVPIRLLLRRRKRNEQKPEQKPEQNSE